MEPRNAPSALPSKRKRWEHVIFSRSTPAHVEPKQFCCTTNAEMGEREHRRPSRSSCAELDASTDQAREHGRHARKKRTTRIRGDRDQRPETAAAARLKLLP